MLLAGGDTTDHCLTCFGEHIELFLVRLARLKLCWSMWTISVVLPDLS